jgi:hypothetical protein
MVTAAALLGLDVEDGHRQLAPGQPSRSHKNRLDCNAARVYSYFNDLSSLLHAKTLSKFKVFL